MILRWRYIVPALLSVLVAVGGYAYWTRGEHDGKDSYVTEPVERGAIASVVTATGTVNPVTTVQVGTYASGPIKSIYVDYNSPVKKDQLVAKIDPAPFQVKVAGAEANLANARAKVEKDRADLEFKKLTLQRNRDLLEKNLIAQNDLDTARSNYDQAVAQLDLDKAGVKQAEAALQEARINLGYTDITSPVDGVVVSRNVDVGQTVAASFQTPTLFLIAQDLTKMQVDTNVSESDIGGVRHGQAAAFTVDAYPGRTFHGSVAQVRNAPITVQNVVTYDVVIAVDNPDLALKPGMTATATITTAQADNVLKVPIRALRFNPTLKAAEGTPAPSTRTDHGPPTIWVVQTDGSLRKTPMQVGIRNDDEAEVVSGELQVGDRVAIALRHSGPRSQAMRPPSFAGGGPPRR
jgi:HlyD family secretion protein